MFNINYTSSGERETVHCCAQSLLVQRRLYRGSRQVRLVGLRPRVSEVRRHLQVQWRWPICQAMDGSPKGEQLNKYLYYLCWSRSRQQWYGNTDPEYQGVVHTEVAHVWPGVSSQQLVFSVTETVTQVSRVRLLQELCGLICSL